METLDALEFAELTAAMKRVAREGLAAARHLRGEVYEVRARGQTRQFRVLFAQEGQASQVILSLTAFIKKTQRTPLRELELAEQRLSDWRARSRPRLH
ncbi:MAG: type II toxin-antitoxin system RelE/ParE family toxin [Deltaproteobacteria bacterium]|nr:type II toxin-antitoxin system RelE/ParE family toxin [Deltaproteobacteria bacterium]